MQERLQSLNTYLQKQHSLFELPLFTMHDLNTNNKYTILATDANKIGYRDKVSAATLTCRRYQEPRAPGEGDFVPRKPPDLTKYIGHLSSSEIAR